MHRASYAERAVLVVMGAFVWTPVALLILLYELIAWTFWRVWRLLDRVASRMRD